MARLRILAAAAGYHGSDAYTCTEGQVCCEGVGKDTECVGIVIPPDTVTVISSVTLSIVMITVDHVFEGRAVLRSIAVLLDTPVPEPICKM